MEKLNKNSKPYLSGEYDDLFDAAESSLLAADQVVRYSESLARLRSFQAGVDYSRAEGRAEGLQLGLEKVAQRMKALGKSVLEIVEITGLDADVVKSL